MSTQAATSQTAVTSTSDGCEPHIRETVGFDRLLGGVELSSLDEGPITELPMIHPMTGGAATKSLKIVCR